METICGNCKHCKRYSAKEISKYSPLSDTGICKAPIPTHMFKFDWPTPNVDLHAKVSCECFAPID